MQTTDAAPFLMVLALAIAGPNRKTATVMAALSEDKVSPVHFHMMNYTLEGGS